jgi:hypothetical protein
MHWEHLLENRYVLAVFTAACGFGFALILERVRNRRVPRKAISWDTSIDKPPRFQSKDKPSKVGISYDGIRVEDLTQIYLRFENRGNTVIKNQYIRFKFPQEAKILEIAFDPTPERELDVVEAPDPNFDVMEKRYRIGHLEAGQSVGLRVAADGGDWSGWSDIHPFNEEGNVLFQRRDVARAREDEEEVEPFITSSTFLLILVLLGSILGQIPSILVVLIAIPLAIYISMKVPKVMRVIRRRLPRPIYLEGAQGVQIGEENTQHNYHRQPGQ